GQFAKPRSAAVEPGPDGTPLPVYRGDAVNSVEPTAPARTPDPRRLLTAYEMAGRVLAHLPSGVYTSHEALLTEYERALVRTDPATGRRYCSSAHLLWAGHRTRQPAGGHVDLPADLANPVAVKVGPGTTPADLTALVDRLDPYREPGRLTLITRFGAGEVRRHLPTLVAAVHRHGARPVWLCDPMHGNTIHTADRRKTRAVRDLFAEVLGFVDVLLRDLFAEVLGFVDVLRAAGGHPGGLHLEMSPQDVTKCVEHRAEALGQPALPRYRTGCDPRLNDRQARRVVADFAAATGPQSPPTLEVSHA
ncbi:3-deoxy-7-phosphoheptulonate synthase, partial [Micromonospora zhanjiangensis]